MKVCRFLKTALVGLSTVALIPMGQAFAVADVGNNQPHYPVKEVQPDGSTVMPFERELSFENSLSDYAIYGEGEKVGDYAFAHRTEVYILTTNESDERQIITHVHTSQVVEVDFDSNGTLYYKDMRGGTYTINYSSTTIKSAAYEGEYSFQGTNKSKLDILNEEFYTLNNDGELTYWKNGATTPFGNGFSMLKSYGGQVFAVKDNLPYNITNSTPGALDRLSLAYIDTDGAKNISTGDTAEKLKQVLDTINIAKIKDGAYYTQINADEIGSTFTVDERGGTQKSVGETSCIVLCESGNASIISKYGNCYITATENLIAYGECAYNNDGKTFYSITDVGVYSAPLMSESTRIATLKSGAEHTVKVLSRFNHPLLNDVEFCKISYEEDGKTVTGFVASNFLTVFNFSAEDNNPSEGGDEVFDYDTNVTSVVLAVVIVGLVIIAALYVAIIFAKDKGTSAEAAATTTKKKKKKEPKITRSYDDLSNAE